MEFPGEKLLIRMWASLVDNGIGSLLRPWQIGREGKAQNEIRRQEKIMLAQAEADANDIRAGRKQLMLDGSLKTLRLPTPQVEGKREKPVARPLDLSVGTIIDISKPTIVVEAAKKEINVTKAIIHAEEVLSNDAQTPPEKQVEEDWILSWREHAGRVSTPELQQLWGKILAGEVKSPGSYSLRTLDFLRGLSKEEAEHITKLASFVIEGRIMTNASTYLEQKGITFNFLMEMQVLGILTGVDSMGLTTTFKSATQNDFQRALRSNGKCLVVRNQTIKDLVLNVHILTKVGKELIGLGSFEPDVEYLRQVGIAIIKEHGCTVFLADWKQETEERGMFFNSVEIKP